MASLQCVHAVVLSSQPLDWLHHDRRASAALEFSLAQGEGLLNSVDMIAGFGPVREAARLDDAEQGIGQGAGTARLVGRRRRTGHVFRVNEF